MNQETIKASFRDYSIEYSESNGRCSISAGNTRNDTAYFNLDMIDAADRNAYPYITQLVAGEVALLHEVNELKKEIKELKARLG